MRKLNFLLASLLMVLWVGSARADNVSPYLIDFNTNISTSAHDFKVATGWSHIVQSAYLSYETKYVDYAYNTTNGVDGSGALYIGSQTLQGDDSGWGYDDESEEVHDYLVTPAVSGTVSIKAKRYYGSHFLQVYKCTKNADGTFTVGDALELSDGTTTSTSFNTLGTDYSTLTIGTFDEPTYLAIRGNQIYIDDFSATSADVELIRSMTITDERAVNTSPDALADGTFPIQLALRVTNNGDYDLQPGDSDYTITVTERESGDSIGTAQLTKPLARGESQNDTITVYGDFSKYPGQTGYKVRENVSHTTYAYQAYLDPVAYAPILTVRNTNGSAIDSGSTVSFGMLTARAERQFLIRNDGAKPMEVNSITVPEGFTVDKSSASVAPHANDTITVAALVEEPGIHSGLLTVDAGEGGKFTLTLTATALDSTKFFADFENGVAPAGSLIAGTNWTVLSWNVDDNKYILENDLLNETKFVTPLLKVTEGEKLSVDVGKRSSSSFVNVYYSPDRKNWTRVDSIGADRMSDHFSSSWGGYKYDLTTFVISGVPAGNWYIGFGSGYAHLDNIYGFEVVPVAHDLAISSTDMPGQGTVNSVYTAKATLSNISSHVESADSYTVKFHFGAEEVDAAARDLAAGTNAQFEFSLTPHKAGTYPAYAEFTFADGYKVTSDTIQVTVGEEVATSEVQVGTIASTGNTPLSLNYYNSESETIYDADLLSGLHAGDKISTITYKGYNPNEAITSTVSVWLQNTTNVPGGTPASVDTLTQVYSGTYTFPVAGSKSSLVPMLTVNLVQPFVYDGHNLRVVVRSENADKWKSVYFERTSEENHTMLRRNDDHDKLFTSSWNDEYTPVVYFGLEKTPTVLTGSVKDTLGTAISGAVVKLTSDNIEYSDTTDAEGNYSVNVIRDNLTYTLRVDAPNYTPAIVPDFTISGTVTRDFQLAPASGLFIEDYSIPAKASVNSDAKATLKLTNDISETIAADDYEATLYLDGKAVATAAGKADIAPGKSQSVNFDFTPHAAGKVAAQIKTVYAGHVYETVVDTIDVAPENFGGEFTAGDSTAISRSSSPQTPWNNWYKYSQSVIVYTPDQLGLDAGSVITNIRYRGYFDNITEGLEATNLFIGNTTLDASADNVTTLLADTASMTRLLNAAHDSIAYGGSNAGEPVHDLINVNIPGGLVYQGGNIVVVFDGNHVGAGDNRVNFVVDDTQSGFAYGRQTDNGNISTSDFNAQSTLPVMYMTVENRRSVSGTVVDKATNAPIAGASVVLKSGNVEYSDSTDAEGHYAFEIAKPALTYDAIFSAEGYDTDTIHAITFESDSLVLNDSLVKSIVYVNIAGKVVNSKTRAGIADVAVKLTVGDSVYNATTDADGKYAVEVARLADTFDAVFTADGYLSDTLTAIAFGDTTAIELNDTLVHELVVINVSGTVRSNQIVDGVPQPDSEAVALSGATVTVKDADDNVLTTTTTDADGKYTVQILEGSDYKFTFSYAGYNDSTLTVTAGDVDQTVDVVLWTSVTTSIDAISAHNGIVRGSVYTLGGQFVGRDVDVKKLSRGVYIINGRKFTVK